MPDKVEYKNLLVPVRHPDDINRVTELASILVDRGKITFITVVEKGNFIKMQKDWRISSEAIDRHRRRVTGRRVRITPKIRYDDTVWKGVLEEAKEQDSDLILLGWGKKITFRSLRQTPVERIFANSNRDVLAFKNRSDSVQNIKKILFPIGGGDLDYSKKMSIAGKIIKETGAEIDLIHVLQEGEEEEEAEEIFKEPKEFLKELGIDCGTEIIRNDDVSEALIEKSEEYDLIVLGPTREYVFSRYLFGWMTDEIVNNAECSALVLKEGEYKWKAWIRGVLDGFVKEIKNHFT